MMEYHFGDVNEMVLWPWQDSNLQELFLFFAPVTVFHRPRLYQFRHLTISYYKYSANPCWVATN